jgi:hypothetical protein
MNNTLRCFTVLSAIAIGLTGVPAYAEVTGFEIASRAPILDGRSFGSSGGYERLEGTLYFAIDPGNPRNRVIADLALAPRNSDGLVEMSADLSILTPVDRARGNGIALVDIANRGRKVALGFNRGEGDAEFGDGFLMERGYTIVWVGWEFDVAARPDTVNIDVPHTTGPEDAPIGGLGFAAVRDAASWIKHAGSAEVSATNALAFGVSQSGRFLRDYLYLGFNTDERGRKVFDGLISHIAGASRIDLNRRGAEPASQGQFSATSFPFADRALRDPVTGVVEGQLENPRARDNQPLIFYTNTSVEYWGGGRVAALVHSSPDGTDDAELPDNVRFYLLAGTQHGPEPFPPAPAGRGQQMGNPIDYWWNMRALLVGMEQWLLAGTEPPASVHPGHADGTLVAPATLGFPQLPGVRQPASLTAGVRVANVLIDANGAPGASLPLLVPVVDADGNETSGIVHPEVRVPLATYTGWNFVDPDRGDPTALVPLAGSYIPFPATRAARDRSGDPRPSIAERYNSKSDYLTRVRQAAERSIADRHLLEADRAPILERAGEHWDLLAVPTD